MIHKCCSIVLSLILFCIKINLFASQAFDKNLASDPNNPITQAALYTYNFELIMRLPNEILNDHVLPLFTALETNSLIMCNTKIYSWLTGFQISKNTGNKKKNKIPTIAQMPVKITHFNFTKCDKTAGFLIPSKFTQANWINETSAHLWYNQINGVVHLKSVFI